MELQEILREGKEVEKHQKTMKIRDILRDGKEVEKSRKQVQYKNVSEIFSIIF